MPLILRPGSAEPWTPYRVIQALILACIPGDAFSYLPSDHAGAGEIVRQTGRSMFFGDVAAVGAFAGDPRIELHGPGYSKVVLGGDMAPRWRESLELMARSHQFADAEQVFGDLRELVGRLDEAFLAAGLVSRSGPRRVASRPLARRPRRSRS
jgi:hypothetical protein